MPPALPSESVGSETISTIRPAQVPTRSTSPARWTAGSRRRAQGGSTALTAAATADQTAAAHGHIDGVHNGQILADLEAGGALARHDLAVVVGRDIGLARCVRHRRVDATRCSTLSSPAKRTSAPRRRDVVDLDGRGVLRHEDDARRAEGAQRIGHGRAMVAGGRRDNAARQHAGLQAQQLVEGAA